MPVCLLCLSALHVQASVEASCLLDNIHDRLLRRACDPKSQIWPRVLSLVTWFGLIVHMQGTTSLLCAVHAKSVDMTKLLLKNKGDITVTTNKVSRVYCDPACSYSVQKAPDWLPGLIH